jgi:hypothetical protein
LGRTTAEVMSARINVSSASFFQRNRRMMNYFFARPAAAHVWQLVLPAQTIRLRIFAWARLTEFALF